MLNRRKKNKFATLLATSVLSAALVWQTHSTFAADGVEATPSTQPADAAKGPMKMVDKSHVPGQAHSGQTQAAPSKANLTLSQEIVDPRQGKRGVTAITTMMSMSMSVEDCVEQKPDVIVKEPTYTGKPLYGAFRIGNGPKSLTYFAMDVSAAGVIGKIYVDKNQNGDLTDDGSNDWDSSHPIKGVMHYDKTVKLHASWGSPVQEKESGEYTLNFNACDTLRGVAYTRFTGRTGALKLGDKVYPIVLSEGANDGLFTVPADGDRTRGATGVLLYIDIDNGVGVDAPLPVVDPTNKHSFKTFSITHQIEVDGHWYMFRPSISGAELTAYETTAPGEAPKPPAPAVTSLLPDGTQAPDFTVQSPGGKPLKLSDYKGKVVVLDFWATWCGPCQQSMPGLEKIYQQVKDQNVVVLSVCVQDEKPAFDKWIGIHADKDYHFTFAYDPAARGPDSVSGAKYNVQGIPAQFIIGPDGKIVGSTMGYDVTERKLVDSLKALGVAATAN